MAKKFDTRLRFHRSLDLSFPKTLSDKFSYLERVDLYNINDKVLFGELTFSPACCVFSYFLTVLIGKWENC